MTNDESVIKLIESITRNIQDNVLKNVKGITKKDILGLMVKSSYEITKALEETPITATSFIAVQILTSVIDTMAKSEYVDINDPEALYLEAMDRTIDNLDRLKEAIKGDVPKDCNECPDKEVCDKITEQENVVWEPSIVH